MHAPPHTYIIILKNVRRVTVTYVYVQPYGALAGSE